MLSQKRELTRQLARAQALEDQCFASLEASYEDLVRLSEEGPAADGSDLLLVRELACFAASAVCRRRAQTAKELGAPE